jgi:hypothetical protein
MRKIFAITLAAIFILSLPIGNCKAQDNIQAIPSQFDKRTFTGVGHTVNESMAEWFRDLGFPEYAQTSPSWGINMPSASLYNYPEWWGNASIMNQLYLKRSPYNTTGMVGWWTFDEGNGIVVYDNSPYNNYGNLTMSNSNDDSLIWVDGVSSKALHFNSSGTNPPTWGYINVNNNTELNMGSSFSISLWVKINGLPPPGTEADIISKNSYQQYRIGIQGSGKLITTIRLTNSSSPPYVDLINSSYVDFGGDPPFYPRLNVWYNVVYVYNASGGWIKLYINTDLKGEKTVTNCGFSISDFNKIVNNDDVNAFQPLKFGVQNVYSTDVMNFANVTLDEVYIFNRPLSEDEIVHYYENVSGVTFKKTENVIGNETLSSTLQILLTAIFLAGISFLIVVGGLILERKKVPQTESVDAGMISSNMAGIRRIQE